MDPVSVRDDMPAQKGDIRQLRLALGREAGGQKKVRNCELLTASSSTSPLVTRRAVVAPMITHHAYESQPASIDFAATDRVRVLDKGPHEARREPMWALILEAKRNCARRDTRDETH